MNKKFRSILSSCLIASTVVTIDAMDSTKNLFLDHSNLISQYCHECDIDCNGFQNALSFVYYGRNEFKGDFLKNFCDLIKFAKTNNDEFSDLLYKINGKYRQIGGSPIRSSKTNIPPAPRYPVQMSFDHSKTPVVRQVGMDNRSLRERLSAPNENNLSRKKSVDSLPFSSLLNNSKSVSDYYVIF